MRHLFVPACFCLMTLSGATGPELLLDKLSGPAAKMQERVPETRASDVPAELPPAARTDTAQVPPGAAVADIPIEIPQQTALEDIAEPVPAYLPPLVPIVKPIIPRSRAEICDSLTDAAQGNNLPVPFFIRLLFQESGFRPGTVSRAGAEGIAQFMPETAADVGLDNPFDPVQAIAASARLLRDLARQFGNLGLAAAAYNAGPKRIQAWLVKKGNLPAETKDYVKTITGRPAENWMVAEAGSPAVKLPRHAPCQETAGLLAWDGPEHIPLPPVRNDKTRKAPTQPAPAVRGAAMAAMRGHVKIARHDAQMTATIDTGAAKVSAKAGVKQDAKHVITHAAVQLAASKQKRKKLQVSER
jgi:transglycosylase-like protein with SLT domain